MSLSETFKSLTAKPAHAVSGVGERIGDLPALAALVKGHVLQPADVWAEG